MVTVVLLSSVSQVFLVPSSHVVKKCLQVECDKEGEGVGGLCFGIGGGHTATATRGVTKRIMDSMCTNKDGCMSMDTSQAIGLLTGANCELAKSMVILYVYIKIGCHVPRKQCKFSVCNLSW